MHIHPPSSDPDPTPDAASEPSAFEPLTPLMCIRLAAPHTWPGPAVLTTVCGGLFAAYAGWGFTPWVWCLLLAVAVLAQSAVNVLNDWADWRAGTDTAENSDDPSDAVLVYNNPNPACVLAYGIALIAGAFACGTVCVVWSGSAIPLVIGIIGVLVLVAYSSGRIKISHLPLGELASGVVMGCLIPLADICVFAGHALAGTAAAQSGGPFSLVWLLTPGEWFDAVICTAPLVLGVAMVMFTQNISDIERDRASGRRTLPVLLGRPRSVIAYRVVTVFWVACVLHLAFWYFSGGFWATCVTLVFALGTLRALVTTPLTHEMRGPSMGAVTKANLFVNGAYALGMLVALAL